MRDSKCHEINIPATDGVAGWKFTLDFQSLISLTICELVDMQLESVFLNHGVWHRRQPLSTHCESTPGSVSMPAWAPAERVSHILQLGLCHQRAPGPTRKKPHETECIFNSEECICAVSFSSEPVYQCDSWRTPIAPLFRSMFETFTNLLDATWPF